MVRVNWLMIKPARRNLTKDALSNHNFTLKTARRAVYAEKSPRRSLNRSSISSGGSVISRTFRRLVNPLTSFTWPRLTPSAAATASRTAWVAAPSTARSRTDTTSSPLPPSSRTPPTDVVAAPGRTHTAHRREVILVSLPRPGAIDCGSRQTRDDGDTLLGKQPRAIRGWCEPGGDAPTQYHPSSCQKIRKHPG